MFILPYREKFIQDNFIEFSFSEEDEDDTDREPIFQKLAKLSPSEQYYLAQHYNWDEGIAILRFIVNSPKCQLATALLIFWASEPEFYLERTAENIPSYEKEVFDLLKTIVAKVAANQFKRGYLGYNPQPEVRRNNFSKITAEWTVPNALYRSIFGIRPLSIGGALNYIAQLHWKRKLKKRIKQSL